MFSTMGRHLTLDTQSAVDVAGRSIILLTLSTAFSGIGAPEVAIGSLFLALQQFSSVHLTDAHRPRTLWCMDRDSECRAELALLNAAMRTDHSTCIFGEITDCVRSSGRTAVIARAHVMGPEDFERLCKSGSLVQSAMFCHAHNKLCDTTRANIHVAGTPCPDWSRAQRDRSGLHGQTALAFYVWVAQRRHVQESAVLHENVQDFPASLLESLLGGPVVLAIRASVSVRASSKLRRSQSHT
jgi:hypothetical protein